MSMVLSCQSLCLVCTSAMFLWSFYVFINYGSYSNREAPRRNRTVHQHQVDDQQLHPKEGLPDDDESLSLFIFYYPIMPPFLNCSIVFLCPPFFLIYFEKNWVESMVSSLFGAISPFHNLMQTHRLNKKKSGSKVNKNSHFNQMFK